MLLRIFVLMIFFSSFSISESIYVKYRGTVDVDNGYFSKLQLKNSSLVKDIYYDKDNKYLLVRLKHTYYHYCSIPNDIVNKWMDAPSLGKYYNFFIKGQYDCRIYPAPTY